MRKGSMLLVAGVALSWAVLSVQVLGQGGGGQVQLPDGPCKALVLVLACSGVNRVALVEIEG